MKTAFIFVLMIIFSNTKAWPQVRNPFELITPPIQVHEITDCMHVTSESGDFVFRKTPHRERLNSHHHDNDVEINNIIDSTDAMSVCGLYVLGEPATTVEITMKHVDVSCEDGGLLGFIDGWELNHQYFPSPKDHQISLDDRVTEFCNDYTKWPIVTYKKTFHSSQNAALLAYRIPIKGSFTASVHFHRKNEPCNILVQDVPALYTLSNFGHRRNCTLMAMYPAVISIINVHIGGRIENDGKKVNYECQTGDRLEIGGTAGLDTHDMEIATQVCGHDDHQGPEQSIYCGVTSLRLVSSGKYKNNVTILIRQADEKDIPISTLVCPF